jgi:hypothetical protein
MTGPDEPEWEEITTLEQFRARIGGPLGVIVIEDVRRDTFVVHHRQCPRAHEEHFRRVVIDGARHEGRYYWSRSSRAALSRGAERCRHPGDRLGARPTFGYDIRAGAAAYAPIIGVFPGFIITAIVLAFTLSRTVIHQHTAEVTFAVGLLVLSFIASVLSSFALAGIGAERETTANLPRATLFVSCATAIGVVGVLAALEVMSAVYLPQATDFFAAITGGGALAVVVFVAYSLSDAWSAGPPEGDEWWERQWIRSRAAAYAVGGWASGLCGLAVVAATIAYFVGLRFAFNGTGVTVLVGVGVAIVIGMTLIGVAFTMHPLARTASATTDDRTDVLDLYRGIRPVEAVGGLFVLTAYLAAVIVSLP